MGSRQLSHLKLKVPTSNLILINITFDPSMILDIEKKDIFEILILLKICSPWVTYFSACNV